MILTPTTSPPQARAVPILSDHAVSTPDCQPLKPRQEMAQSQPTALVEECLGEGDFLENLKVPTVVLGTPSISHTMAAGLSLSLLAHTLFLKSQVPFPVAQLSRMPGGKSNAKTVKKRDELLATFDTLSSHLRTTFVALSTAYANRKSAQTPQALGDENDKGDVPLSRANDPGRGAAHLMFVLGPSVSAARARILLTIDGLDVKVWGARTTETTKSTESDDKDTEEEEEEEFEEEESDDSSSQEGSDDESEDELLSGADDDTSADELSDAGSSAAGSGPPPSRSPSPSSPLQRSLAPSPESLPSPQPILTPLPEPATPFTFVHPPPSAMSVTTTFGRRSPSQFAVPAPPPPTEPQSQPQSSLPPPVPAPSISREATPVPELTYAEEQQALRAAERLLSRTLMNAWVDGEGDMSSELAPTQTHIFLRAPRRFMHPAWAARQNLTRTLDGVLDAFLQDAGAIPAPPSANGKNRPKNRGVHTEGAWIGCRGGSAFSESLKEKAVSHSQRQGQEGEDEHLEEEDEEIWWAWEGKIVGFADW